MGDKTKDTKETAATTPSGEATTGNVGLSPDVYADDRAITEAANESAAAAAEAHAVPEEALTDEAKEYIEEGEKAKEEEEAEAEAQRKEAEQMPVEGSARAKPQTTRTSTED